MALSKVVRHSFNQLRKTAPVISGVHSTVKNLDRHITHDAKSSSSAASMQRLDSVGADNLMDIGIRKIFTEEHDMLRESIRKFYKEEAVPFTEQWEQDGQVSRELWEKAGQLGFLGINIPAEHGGVGADYLSSAVLVEEQTYLNLSGPGFPLHNEIAMPYISNYGSREQIQKYIPDMAAGKKIGAIAMTEPSAGSDLQGIRTNAKKIGSDWILNGSKVFITNGFLSDVVIVVALTNRDAKSPAHGLSLFLVDEGTPGFKKGRKLNKMGLKAQDTAELFFEDVRLPESAVLGEINTGFYKLMAELPQERILISELALAGAEFMFEETRTYVKERKAFGKKLANLQTIQHKMAEMKTAICVARSFVDQLLVEHNHSGVSPQQASMAKYWTSDLVNKVAYECVQLHGGWGYMLEYPITRAYLDARIHPIWGGTNEIMKELIARQTLFGA